MSQQLLGNYATPHLRNMNDGLENKIEDLKTDEKELTEVLSEYDLDTALAQEFNQIDKQFRQLEIKYQSLINARRFLKNAQT